MLVATPFLSSPVVPPPPDVETEYQAIGKHPSGISFFQVRHKKRDRGSYEDYYSMIMGVSDYKYPSTSPFLDTTYSRIFISKTRWRRGSTRQSALTLLYGGYRGPIIDYDIRTHEVFGTYRGAMLGVKHDDLSGKSTVNLNTLSHQYITGDATITLTLNDPHGTHNQFGQPRSRIGTDVVVEFSNIEDLNTGNPVQIAKTRFELHEDFLDISGGALQDVGDLGRHNRNCTNCLGIRIGGDPNIKVANGAFAISDAFGVFATKQ